MWCYLRKIDHLGARYDTCSVMHYGAYAFAKVILVSVSQESEEMFDLHEIVVRLVLAVSSVLRARRFYCYISEQREADYSCQEEN